MQTLEKSGATTSTDVTHSSAFSLGIESNGTGEPQRNLHELETFVGTSIKVVCEAEIFTNKN
jgi:hypothetical protein